MKSEVALHSTDIQDQMFQIFDQFVNDNKTIWKKETRGYC